MGLIVKMPLLNVNDESALLVSWLLPEGSEVEKDQAICVVETTKSTVELNAERRGFLRQLAPAGESCAVGRPIGFLAETADEPVPDLGPPSPAAAAQPAPAPNWTRKAQILAERLGVDLAKLAAAHPGARIGEELVQQAASQAAAPQSPARASAWSNQERILILGGGGGAALVLDILSGILSQKAVAIVDNNPALAGTTLMGVPIVGGFDLVQELWRDNKFDALISTVVRDVHDRAAIFERFSQIGIPFTNVVSPRASIRSEVRLGRGNLVVEGAYIATGVEIGDNNFLAAGTYIEHHSSVGSHCTFGPRTTLSGRVKVGDLVKFGMQVAVEPFVQVGTGSIIASGVVLTAHVPEHAVVKSASNPVIRAAG